MNLHLFYLKKILSLPQYNLLTISKIKNVIEEISITF